MSAATGPLDTRIDSDCQPDSLRRFIQIFDGALDTAFCARMIDTFDQLSGAQARNGRGLLKHLESSSWTELNVSKSADAGLAGYFREQAASYLARYNEAAHLTIPIPLRPRMEDLRIKRYSVAVGDRFQPHFDSLDYTSNRYMVFLWYLNDVATGGETMFCDLDVKVSARAGRLLMFPPFWMFQHAGLPPLSNDKFILSTYMLF